MSLRIEMADIVAVLIGPDWYPVHDGTFVLDSYEFFAEDTMILGGGRADGVCATGYHFTTKKSGGDLFVMNGPLTAILAVKRRGE